MAINSYSIGVYWWLFYLMAIGGYFTGGYFIDGYWWLFYWWLFY